MSSGRVEPEKENRQKDGSAKLNQKLPGLRKTPPAVICPVNSRIAVAKSIAR